MLLYRILRFLLRVSVWIFFKDVHVQGRELAPKRGPVIVAVNHPNTVMDPIVVALHLHQRTGFLANGGIFANGFLRWIFARLHLIPVYRQQDVAPGAIKDNTSSFRKCYQYLQNGGTLMIFPEGSSVHEMKLRQLKTGTARIALETAAQQNFASGLEIVPVSLTYLDPIRFRSRLFVQFDHPIPVDAYATAYRKDPVDAVHALTEHIRELLEKNMVTTAHKEQEELLLRIKKLYKDQLLEKNRRSMNHEQEFELLQQISKGMTIYQRYYAHEYQRIQQKINLYFDSLQEASLKEGFFAAGFTMYKKAFLGVGNLILLVIAFPLFLLGLVTNYIPYILPSCIAKALGTDIEYRAGIMLLCGLVVFPLYYAGITVAIYHLFNLNWLQTLVFSCSLPLLGFFVLHYCRVAAHTVSLAEYLRLKHHNQKKYIHLKSLRWEIKHELESAVAVLREAPQFEITTPPAQVDFPENQDENPPKITV